MGRKKVRIMILAGVLLGITLCSLLRGKVLEEEKAEHTIVMEDQLFGGKKNVFGNVRAPKGFDWRQCEGVTLDFAVENNLNADVLSKECDRFTEVTGIKVRIRNMDFDTLSERINMEFLSQAGVYDLIYVDPYRALVL